MSLPEDNGFMSSKWDWNEIQYLWLKIDPCVVYMNDGIGIEILYDNI